MKSKKRASHVFAAALVGVDAAIIRIEGDQRPGIVKTTIVGLADKACAEAKERVKSALRNSGYRLPEGQFTFNLSPADLPKTGSGFDLGMAIAMLIRTGVLPQQCVEGYLFLGELALDGSILPVPGVLASAQAAKDAGLGSVILPRENEGEASLLDGVNMYCAGTLQEVVDHLHKSVQLGVARRRPDKKSRQYPIDFADIQGHAFAKRALEIAAAGSHNVFLSGPPGSGKTMLAKALISILPPLEVEEMIEVTKIHSAAGLLGRHDPFVEHRPWRDPHHSSSSAALVGGGTIPRPGEISLAHHGLLFLDELPEFPRMVLENLRQPLESGVMTVSRARQTLQFPARFLLVASMNPCPCGFYGDQEKTCHCLHTTVTRYQQKISGPLLDRFDLFLEVPRLPFQELHQTTRPESSEQIAQRVLRARECQIARYPQTGVSTNQQLSSAMVSKLIHLTPPSKTLLRQAMDRLQLSNRAYYRILRVARTIADRLRASAGW